LRLGPVQFFRRRAGDGANEIADDQRVAGLVTRRDVGDSQRFCLGSGDVATIAEVQPFFLDLFRRSLILMALFRTM